MQHAFFVLSLVAAHLAQSQKGLRTVAPLAWILQVMGPCSTVAPETVAYILLAYLVLGRDIVSQDLALSSRVRRFVTFSTLRKVS